MSWSFVAVGKPAAILEKARKDMTTYRCAEPEETIKGKVLNIIEASLLAFPEASAIEVNASGSQSMPDPGHAINSLSVTIKPLYGFIE